MQLYCESSSMMDLGGVTNRYWSHTWSNRTKKEIGVFTGYVNGNVKTLLDLICVRSVFRIVQKYLFTFLLYCSVQEYLLSSFSQEPGLAPVSQ